MIALQRILISILFTSILLVATTVIISCCIFLSRTSTSNAFLHSISYSAMTIVTKSVKRYVHLSGKKDETVLRCEVSRREY